MVRRQPGTFEAGEVGRVTGERGHEGEGVEGRLGHAHAGVRPRHEGGVADERDAAADHRRRHEIVDRLQHRAFGARDDVGEGRGEEARPLAGGPSLLPAMAMRLAAAELLVDIGDLAELRGIELREDGWLRLGALTRHRGLATDPLVADRAPLLRQAAPLVAHEAIRSRGTLG